MESGKNKDIRILIENFFSLSILQGANYILPLLTLPYLVRVLGPEKFGLLAFAQAFVAYFGILIDYGFNLSATKEVSIYRDHKEKLNEIFSSVTVIKIILFLLSFIIMSIIVFSFDKFKNEWLLYYIILASAIVSILFPVWLFQGLEKMKYITFINITTKIIFTILVFIVIKTESDYYLVPVLNLFSGLISGFWAMWIIFKKFNISFQIPSFSSIRYYLIEGGHLFISRVGISSYTISTPFILGLLTNNTLVGYYSIAEKLISIIKSFINIFTQTMFPFVSKKMKESFKDAIRIILIEIKMLVPAVLFISICLFVFSEDIIKLLFGEIYVQSVLIFQILVPIPLIILLSMILGQQILFQLKMIKIFTLSIIFASFIHLILLPINITLFGLKGAAITVVITELNILVYRIIGIYLNKELLYIKLKEN